MSRGSATFKRFILEPPPTGSSLSLSSTLTCPGAAALFPSSDQAILRQRNPIKAAKLTMTVREVAAVNHVSARSVCFRPSLS